MDNNNEIIILTNPETRVKVSSTIQGGAGEYSKQNIFDNNMETSWYSNQGKFQYIFIFFNESVSINEFDITFSGGFCPKEIEVLYSEEDEAENKKPNLIKAETFEAENKNEEQQFILKTQINKCKTLKLLMKKFYDLYGRIIVYDMKIKGKP